MLFYFFLDIYSLAVQHSRDGLGKRKEGTKRPAENPQPIDPNNSTPSSSSTTSDYDTTSNPSNQVWSPMHQGSSSTTSPQNQDNYAVYYPNGTNGQVTSHFANLVS